MFVQVLHRWRDRRAERQAARVNHEAIIYIDGSFTKWIRSRSNHRFEEHKGGLRIALPDAAGRIMPAPDERDVLQRRSFVHEWSARIWVLTRLHGFDTTKIVGEVRPL